MSSWHWALGGQAADHVGPADFEKYLTQGRERGQGRGQHLFESSYFHQ